MNTEELKKAILAGDVEGIEALEREAEASRLRERAERVKALAAEAEELKAELKELRPQFAEARARVLAASDAIVEATKKRELLSRDAGNIDNRASMARGRLRVIEAEQAELLAEISREADVRQAAVVHDLRHRR